MANKKIEFTKKTTIKTTRFVIKSNMKFLSGDFVGRRLVEFKDAEIFYKRMFAKDIAVEYFISGETWEILPVIVKLEQEFDIIQKRKGKK